MSAPGENLMARLIDDIRRFPRCGCRASFPGIWKNTGPLTPSN